MSDFSELISFKKDREEMRTESVYYVQHRNKRSVLDQELIITGDLAFRTYKASMEMKDFPKCGSEREAALKLAEWMLNRPGFPGEYFICELRLPDHYFRWKHNKLFLLLPEEYGPAFPAIVDCYTSPPTLV
ncbi:hypothetical protein, partial [Escherichia coli]|uniref:hypothetical protein n=3 Tax=Escherichia coli TaxID=562 RepID=UPI0020258B3D